MKMSRRLLLLELNEVNFEFIKFYCTEGLLPNLNALISRSGYIETISESRYEHLEPWIQWVTAHTGKAFADHGVFRLGDITSADHLQIWEFLESRGLKVGAVSPMNAANKLKSNSLFIPDPWTPTMVTAPLMIRHMFGAIKQAVNDNAKARISLKSAIWLMLGLVVYSSPRNYVTYLQHLLRSRQQPWSRSIVLDMLLADIFERQVARNNIDFASLFLNSAAHIQHHYMFSSRAYRGECRNPSSYIAEGIDPVLDVYQVYDRILGSLQRKFPDARIMIATGLHQEPHEKVTYYWRLKEHETFLRELRVPFASVEPRMSRDFVVRCADISEALQAEKILSSTIANDGVPLFEVDNRGSDLFVMLTYPRDISADTTFSTISCDAVPLLPAVVFVAIKNGEHNGVGYFIDSGAPSQSSADHLPLKELPRKICEALEVRWPSEWRLNERVVVPASLQVAKLQ